MFRRTAVLFNRPHRRLGRKSSHRKALLRNMVTSLFEHERIETTFAKAKECQRKAEKVITYAKRQFLKGATEQQYNHSLRLVSPVVFTGDQRIKAMEVLAYRYQYRQGGYTRVMRLSKRRKGDNAPLAVVELVDRPGEIRAARPATMNPALDETLFEEKVQEERTIDKMEE